RAFGLSVADRVDFETFTLIYMSNSETCFELELTVNKGRTAPYDLGNAYCHLAVSVEELAVAVELHQFTGLEPELRQPLALDRHLFD
ncbi:lactoylglutathione lyase, partial [Rhizobium ruizarguesonis]